jgi:hypothetical protein
VEDVHARDLEVRDPVDRQHELVAARDTGVGVGDGPGPACRLDPHEQLLLVAVLALVLQASDLGDAGEPRVHDEQEREPAGDAEPGLVDRRGAREALAVLVRPSARPEAQQAHDQDREHEGEHRDGQAREDQEGAIGDLCRVRVAIGEQVGVPDRELTDDGEHDPDDDRERLLAAER